MVFSLSLLSLILNIKVRKSLFSSSSFLFNHKVPLTFKRFIIQLYIISKALYFAPLLGSNKSNSKIVQSLINTSLLRCIDSDSSNKENYLNIDKKKKYIRVISKGTQRLVFMPYIVIFKYFQLMAFVLLFK